MIEAKEFFEFLTQHQVEIWLENGKLRYRAPKHLLTTEIKQGLIKYKDYLIDHLNQICPIIRIQRDQPLQLSYAQKRLWFLQQLDTKNIFYNIPLIIWLEGELNVDALQQAINKLIERHEILRTAYKIVNNEPTATINLECDFELKVIDLSQANETNHEETALKIVKKEARKPFDLSKSPLMKTMLVKTSQNKFLFLLSLHHIIADGWALKLIGSELANLYEHFNYHSPLLLPEIDYQYVDFADWQQRWVKTKKLEQQLRFWQTKLANLPTLLFPTDHVRPSRQSFRGNMVNFIFDKSVSHGIAELSKEFAVTDFVTVASIVNLLLHYYTDQDEIVIGTPISNRPQNALENMIGTFMNTLVLRTDLSGNLNFEEVLQRTCHTVIEAFDNQDIPFDVVVESISPERNLSHSPLFQFLFLYEAGKSSVLEFKNLKVTPINLALGTTRFDIVLLLSTTERGLEGALEYSVDLFEESTIMHFIAHLELLFKKIINNRNVSMSTLSLLTTEEQFLLSSNRHPSLKANKQTCTQQFEFIAEKYYDVDAVIYNDESLNYRELNIKANILAHYLLTYDIKPGDIIAIFLHPSIEMITCLIAIIKAGAVFLPIDPSYPSERIHYIVEDSQPTLIITQTELQTKLTGIDNRIFLIDQDIHRLENTQTNNLTQLIHEQSPIYMIYTSGSTGAPHGVVVQHQSVLNLNNALNTAIYNHYDAIHHVLVNGSIGFDTSIKQIIQLLNGRSLHLINDEIRYGGQQFIEYLVKHRIDIVDLTPSKCSLLIRYGLLDYPFSHKLIVLLGGEKIDSKLWTSLKSSQRIDFYNVYGPTECTVDATTCKLSDYERPIIGKPIINTDIYILNRHLNKVPINVPGEIYISGIGVSQGYWKNPALTASKFLSDPYSPFRGNRMYKTGDRGRFLANGAIIFEGRLDNQVKVRGFRIELEEIESILLQHPDIVQSAVSLDNHGEDTRLVAYIVANNERSSYYKGYKRYRLKNGLAIVHLNKNETDFLYRDIFEHRAYFQHGISLQPNAIVIDVGTNIGLFSLQAHFQASNVTIYCFEPNPFVSKIAAANFELYKVNAYINEVGLGREEKNMEFTFYPKMSFLSGLHADIEEEKQLIHSYLVKNNLIENHSDTTITDILDHKLEAQKLVVPISTLSKFIAEKKLEKIDLLKINVEKAELDVLLGLQEADWNKIKQIVLEAHDVNNRLQDIEKLLVKHDFVINTKKDWSLEESQNIFYIYASKNNVETPYKMYIPVSLLEAPEITHYLETKIPHYMIPSKIIFLDCMPLNSHGKIDRKKLSAITDDGHEKQPDDGPLSEIEQTIRTIWKEVLNVDDINIHDNFFDIGGHSLMLTAVHARLQKEFVCPISLIDLFEFPTVYSLSRKISHKKNNQTISTTRISNLKITSIEDDDQIAVIGLAGRFPDCKNINSFWQALISNKNCISHFSHQELVAEGITDNFLHNSNYIKAKGYLEDIEMFDADFFGYSPREAELLDPQQRIFLECAWEALENAGYGSLQREETVGLFAGQTLSTYFINHILQTLDLQNSLDTYQAMIANDKDHLVLRTAYKLNLTGPSIAIQTACSTSLAAVYMACQSLLRNECDMALAGGISIVTPNKVGYFYTPNGIFSPDGYCRAFDHKSNGTVPGNGVGLVVLKKLNQAKKAGDTIHGIIKASAINNDGHNKAGYTTPSITGQAAVISRALKQAHIDPNTISYIETHGTGTQLGDPIELKALAKAFENTSPDWVCQIGSVKTNIGHLDAAAGIVSLIKVILALKNKTIPATLHFSQWNKKIDCNTKKFQIVTENRSWEPTNSPRRAGVSAFGIGGTNVHVILEEAPIEISQQPAKPFYLCVFSAKNRQALEQMLCDFIHYLENNQFLTIADISYTLLLGRQDFSYRKAFICDSTQQLLQLLKADASKPSFFQIQSSSRSVIICFLGQGQFYSGIASELYNNEVCFRSHIDECAQILIPEFGLDIRDIIKGDVSLTKDEINALCLCEPLLFAIEYALAQTYLQLDLQIAGIMGVGFGEYTAACIAGVFNVKEALQLITLRGNLDKFQLILEKINFQEPKITLITNLSKKSINTLACKPDYWLAHARQTARFTEDINTLYSLYPNTVFIEIGSCQPLLDQENGIIRINSLPTNKEKPVDAYQYWLNSILNCWLSGLNIAWQKLFAGERPNRIQLPHYPFQKKRFWIDSKPLLGEQQFTNNSSNPETLLHQRPELSNNYTAPCNDIENELVTIWEELLGIKDIGIQDNFFELGGSSLLVLQLQQRIYEKFALHFPILDTYNIPCVEEMATQIEQQIAEIT